MTRLARLIIAIALPSFLTAAPTTTEEGDTLPVSGIINLLAAEFDDEDADPLSFPPIPEPEGTTTDEEEAALTDSSSDSSSDDEDDLPAGANVTAPEITEAAGLIPEVSADDSSDDDEINPWSFEDTEDVSESIPLSGDLIQTTEELNDLDEYLDGEDEGGEKSLQQAGTEPASAIPAISMFATCAAIGVALLY